MQCAGNTCDPRRSKAESRISRRPAAPDAIPNPAPTLSGTSVRDLLFGEQESITRSTGRAPVLRVWAVLAAHANTGAGCTCGLLENGK